MQRRMHSARDQRSEGHRRATCQRSPARTRDQATSGPGRSPRTTLDGCIHGVSRQ